MNRVTLIGELQDPPDLKFSQGGVCVLKLNLRVETPGEDARLHTSFHRVTFIGKRWEGTAKHLHAGKRVLVEGSMQSSSYVKDGKTFQKYEAAGKEIRFL